MNNVTTKMILFSIFFLLLGSQVWADTGNTNSTTLPNPTQLKEQALTPSDSKVLGSFDFRPSYTSQKGTFHTENTISLGYQLNANTELSFTHDFNTNLYDPKNLATDNSLNLTAIDAFVRAKFSKIWTSPDGSLSLGYESRLYYPATESQRTNGLITIFRNYLKMSKTLHEKVTITFVELPILHIYDRSGSIDSGGSASSNPFFENRMYLITDFQITPSLSFSLPVMFHLTRYANFQSGASKNNSWSYYLWIYPELTYSISDRVAMALAYYNNDGLVTEDLSSFNIGPALESGVTQLSLQVSL